MISQTSHQTPNPGTPRDTLLCALQLLNCGDFYEVHEVLEPLWRTSSSPQERACAQGLIQAAVSLYHYSNANFSGAKHLANQAIEKLAFTGQDPWGVIDVPDFLKAFRGTVAPLLAAASYAQLWPLDPRESPMLLEV